MNNQYYIGIMSGTSMDGVDAVLISMQNEHWQAAIAHEFIPYPESLKQELLDLQETGHNELHRSLMLSQKLSHLYAQAVNNLLKKQQISSQAITALGCHGQTVRHNPECGYSIQLANLPLLAELTGIFTVGDFRSRDLAAGGQGAPLVPAFHHALFHHTQETRVVLNIGGISNISVLPSQAPVFGFDTGPGNMLMDSWMQHIWQLPYDQDGQKSMQGQVLPDLLHNLLQHPYFKQPYPKSTGRELFSLNWLKGHLKGNERPEDVLKTLLQYTAQTIFDAIMTTAADVKNIYVCGGGIQNKALMQSLSQLFAHHNISLHSSSKLNLDPQWVEAAAFGWLAAFWINHIPSNPHHATGANKPCILGSGHYA